MKVLCMTERGIPEEKKYGKLEILDMPMPEVGDEDVLIRICYSAICGSAPHIRSGMLGSELPTGMGHEMCGIVGKVGAKVGKGGTHRDIKVGDKVTGNSSSLLHLLLLPQRHGEPLPRAGPGLERLPGGIRAVA